MLPHLGMGSGPSGDAKGHGLTSYSQELRDGYALYEQASTGYGFGSLGCAWKQEVRHTT